jgi:hypothetical protein
MSCRTNAKQRFMATPPTPVIAFEIHMLHHYVTFAHAAESIWFRAMLKEQEIVLTTQKDVLQSLEKRIPEMKSRDLITFSVSQILEKLLSSTSLRLISLVKENSVYTEKQVWFSFCKYILLPTDQLSPTREASLPRVSPMTPSSATSRRLSWNDADIEDIVIDEPISTKKSLSNINEMFSYLQIDDDRESNSPNSPDEKVLLSKGKRSPRKKRENNRKSIYAIPVQMGKIEDYVQRLMEQPEVSLTTEESIFCLRSLLPEKVNTVEIDELASLVLVLGATGSGKSTAINWLYGCEMERIVTGHIHVVPAEDTIPTRIGDGTTFPTTLKPALVTIPSDSYLCFCDCPGSLSVSFPEYSVANLINLLPVLKATKDTICLYVLSLDTIEDSSSLEKALREFVARFGGIEAFNRCSESVCIGITFVEYHEKKVKPPKNVIPVVELVDVGAETDKGGEDEEKADMETKENLEDSREQKENEEEEKRIEEEKAEEEEEEVDIMT